MIHIHFLIMKHRLIHALLWERPKTLKTTVERVESSSSSSDHTFLIYENYSLLQRETMLKTRDKQLNISILIRP